MQNGVIMNGCNLFKTHHQWFKKTGFAAKSYLYTQLEPKDTSILPGSLPLENSPGLCHRPAAEFTTSRHLRLHFRIILWMFFAKNNIRKLSLLSKMGISRIAWVNLWLYIYYQEKRVWFYFLFIFSSIDATKTERLGKYVNDSTRFKIARLLSLTIMETHI